MRLIQLAGKDGRAAGIVENARIRLLKSYKTVYQLAMAALDAGSRLALAAQADAAGDTLDYDEIYSGKSAWRILPPIDHPDEPARCMVSGTGLSHMGSASNRQAMHAVAESQLTDSMRMFNWGVEGGRPDEGKPGVSPEWFYKGTGGILRAHGEPLTVPGFGEDGGDESELAGVYVIDRRGVPCRIGIVAGNEFSDHVVEKKNYLYLASSKLRECAIGPEMAVDPNFRSVQGEASVLRGGQVVWSKPLHTGEDVMCHSLANIEHHHFKFDPHRIPGDVHIHFFGASAFSFGDGIRLSDGDVMKVQFEGYGRPLLNPVRIVPHSDRLVSVRAV
jgi:hypothetical protein